MKSIKSVKNIKGMTLIELMIAVVIIGILAAVSVPTYQTYVFETNRTDAYIALEAMAASQERYSLANNGVYAAQANIANVGGAATAKNYYTLAITSASVTGFSVTATAVATGPQANDTACPALTINQALQKTPAACW